MNPYELQPWRVLSPETRQIQELPLSYPAKFKQIFSGPATKFDAWSLLARPMKPCQLRVTSSGTKTSEIESLTNEMGTLKMSSNTKLSKLESLTNEIIEIIIQHLRERSDIAALGFSSERLWALVRRHIQKEILKGAAPWAGKKLALMGSFSGAPPFMEGDLVRRMLAADYTYSPYLGRRFSDAGWQFAPPPKEEQLEWAAAINQHAGRILIPDERWKELMRDMRCSDFFPEDQAWLLRNLTTREYVSSETLGVKVNLQTRASDFRGVPAFNFMLLMRICWTNATEGSDAYGIHRGVWAGHCFDIVSQQFHEVEEGAEAWRDTTDEMVSEQKMLQLRFAKFDLEKEISSLTSSM